MGYIERSRLPQIDSLAFSNGIVIVGALANRKHAPAFARIVTSYIQLMGWNRDAQELPKIIGVISTENVVVLGLNCVSSDRELILIQETSKSARLVSVLGLTILQLKRTFRKFYNLCQVFIRIKGELAMHRFIGREISA